MRRDKKIARMRKLRTEKSAKWHQLSWKSATVSNFNMKARALKSNLILHFQSNKNLA